jgi:hypothetical protein
MFSRNCNISLKGIYALFGNYKVRISLLSSLTKLFNIGISDILRHNKITKINTNTIPPQHSELGHKNSRRKIEWHGIFSEAERIISGEIRPMRVADFCRRHGIDYQTLYSKNSELCKQIKNTHDDQIKLWNLASLKLMTLDH